MEGPGAAAQGAQDHHLRRARARSAPSHTVTVNGHDGSSATLDGHHVCWPPARCPARSPASSVDGKIVMTSDEVLDLDDVPERVGRDRRRRHRLRVRLDCSPTSAPRSPSSRRCRKILPGRATPTWPTSWCGPSRSGASTIRTERERSPATSPTDVAAPACSIEGAEPHRGRRRWSCRSAGGRYADLLGLDGTAVEVTSGASSWSTSCAAPAEPGVYAVGDLIATPAAGPRRLRRGHPRRQATSSASSPCRSSTTGCRGRSTAIPRSPSPATREESAKEAGLDVVASKHQYRGNGRAQIIGEHRGHGEGDRREGCPTAPAGQVLGVHMVGPWVTEQLGQGYLAVNWEATVAEVAAVHPAPPDAVRAVRRDVMLTALLTGRKAASRTGLMADIAMPQLGETVTEGTITKWFKAVGDRSPRTSSCSRCRPTRWTPRCPRRSAASLLEIRVHEGETVDVGAVIAVVGDAVRRRRAPGRRRRRGRSRRTTPAGAGSRRAAEAAAEARAARPSRRRRLRPRLRRPRPRPRLPRPSPPPPPPARRRRRRAAAAGTAAGAAAPAGARRQRHGCCRRSCAGWSNEHGLDAAQITGTGAGGRITREDVLAHIDSAAPPRRPRPPPAAPAAAAPAAGARRRPRPAARRPAPAAARPRPAGRGAGASATRSSSSPRSARSPASTWCMSKATSRPTPSASWRSTTTASSGCARAQDEWKASEGFTLTYLPFICRAVVDAIADFPHMNASVGDGELVVHRYVEPRHRRRPRLPGPDRPGRPRRRRQAPAGHRPRDQRPGRPGPHPQARPDEIRAAPSPSPTTARSARCSRRRSSTSPRWRSSPPTASSAGRWSSTCPTAARASPSTRSGNLAMSWDHRAFDGAYAAASCARSRRSSRPRDWAAEL